MPRPKNPRTIHAPPSVDGFKSRGDGENKEIILSVEEFEAIRLVDFEGLDQTRAAELMGISRQTFGRVLKSGRFTLSQALVKGLHLKVTGGCYKIRGHRHGQGNGNGLGNQRRRQGAIEPMEQQLISGGNIMVENNETDGQKTKNTPPPESDSGRGKGTGQGSGTGQGQGRGRGLGGGKGDGSCRKKDGGMGRGLGGGKRDGSRGGQ